ncbi:hypothetical protein GKZ92_05390 [Gordonia sp. 135]|uniref:hypothetical protein n=1 Tax=Gordonia sp. 135 TaxID=2676309 RepID=UPI0012BB347B|nr:hypothetical protein [Gordonia sp. 135]QGP87133.1 hypothetical protein GKZ92_05390 [Gordonia sp. 135]
MSRIYDNRFQTALFILAAIVVILLGSRLQGRSGILLLLAGLTAAMYLFYPAVAISGALGERAQAQQIRDNANDASFLLSIRKELPMTAYLAGSNLPTGIGSYSAIDIEQSGRALTFVESFTGPTERSEVVYLTGGLEASTLGYKAHSQAFSAILFAGLLAIPFWLWAGFKLLGGITNVCARRSPVPGLTFYMITLALWDTLFSPMNANTHLTLGFALFLVLLALNSRKSSSVPLVAKAARKGSRGTPESLDNASNLMDCHVPTMYRG